MATAQTIINRAATLANILPVGGTLASNINNHLLDLLNDLFESWKNKGIDLGVSTLALSDTVYIDDSDLLAVRYNLAVSCYDVINRAPNPVIIQKAQELLQELQAKYHDINDLSMPESLNSRYSFDINSG